MTPFGHASLAMIVRQALDPEEERLSEEGLALGAVLPDLDLLLEPLLPKFHRTVLHSILFVTLAALVGHRRFGFRSLFLGGLSHLVVDSVLDDRLPEEAGMPILFPLLGRKLRTGFSLLPVRPNGSTLLDRLLDALRIETPFLATAATLVTGRLGQRAPRPSASPATLGEPGAFDRSAPLSRG